LSGEVKGNHVLILDDIVDTAESTEGTIEAVKRSSNSDEIQFTVVSPFAKAEITDPGFEKEDAVVILRNKGIPVYKIGEDENQGGDRVNDIVYYYTEKVPGIWLNAGAGMASDKTSPQKQRRENTSLNPNFTKETEVPTLLELAAMDPEMQAKVLQRMARFDALERLTGACITGSIGDMDEYEKFLLSIIGKENIDEDQLFNTIFAMVFIQYRRQVEEAGGQKSSRPLILEIGEPAKELFENRKAA
jgi:hypothetical protein